jgi:Transposase DDE domain group 1
MGTSPITIGVGNGAAIGPLLLTPAQRVAPPAQDQPRRARQAEFVICDQSIENLIKAHKRHLASDRTSCTKATANQFRLVLHTAAYWLLHTLRGSAPKASFWREAQFDTIRLALIKVAARVTELATRIKVALPSGYPYRDSLILLAARAAKPP